MKDVNELIDGYRKFYKQYFLSENDSTYRFLANGQRPSTLFIGCSDSRADPAILTNANPGDIFVIRNVANLVPQYQPEWSTCHGVSAAIEFAVRVLNVCNVVVMGHSDCGGIKSLLDNNHFQRDSFIDGWLNIAHPVKEEVAARNCGKACNYSLAEQLAVKLSLENLLTFPYIKSRVAAGEIMLHGWHFSVSTGVLRVYNSSEDSFQPVEV